MKQNKELKLEALPKDLLIISYIFLSFETRTERYPHL